MKTLLAAVVLLLLAIVPASAASIGDPAPPLTIERWIKGSPVRVGPGTNIYVVEFWATWCAPCQRSIPHLTELQNKYRDNGVVFVGISDEPFAKVSPFVAGKGDTMNYRVAIDPSKRSFNSWMMAFGASGIPHAFIVGTNGLVWWHDFPNDNLDRALKQILAGTFGIEKAKNFETGNRLVDQYAAMVKKAKPDPKAAALGEQILSDYASDWRIPHRLAKAILTEASPPARDLELALRATLKSTELTKQKSADAQAMHARALYANGRKSEAVASQKQAIAVNRDPGDQPELAKQLAFYEKGLAQITSPGK